MREERKVLRVAFPEAEGYTMITEDGKRKGLVVDFLDEISKYTGWEYEYIDVKNDEILDRFEARDFDLMGGQYYMDGYEAYFNYPKYNCGYSKLILLARQNDHSIKSYDLNSFNGKTIGVYERAKENIRRLEIYLKLNNLDCTLKYYNNDQIQQTGDLTPYLENKEVDLILGKSTETGEDYYVAASFDSQPHFIVTHPEDQETLDGLNMALEKIYESDPSFARQVYEANFPDTFVTNLALNEQEKAFCGSD